MDSIDTSFLTNNETIEYTEKLKSMVLKKQIETFTQQLPDSHDLLVEMLESMTEFNPYFRPSAKELLKNKIFDDMRVESNE